MIVVTGAYGFIGSYLVGYLNEMGHRDIVVVDDFYQDRKEPNLIDKGIREWIHRDIFLAWFAKSARYIDVIFHLGARTDTTSTDREVFDRLNLKYSQEIWKICAQAGVHLIYASSAATYGDGAQGYSDDHEVIPSLVPMNAYAESKQAFDLWALNQKDAPPRWSGLKFFNVYGPNEYHKKRMASVVWHGFNQIRTTGALKLFQSHRKGIADGEQKRDFIYVRDIAGMCTHLMKNPSPDGIYNAGTGKARTFLDLGKTIFAAMGVDEKIEFVPTPENIRETYQYFTEAEMTKLRETGYRQSCTSLEDGVREYVQQFLMPGICY